MYQYDTTLSRRTFLGSAAALAASTMITDNARGAISRQA